MAGSRSPSKNFWKLVRKWFFTSKPYSYFGILDTHVYFVCTGPIALYVSKSCFEGSVHVSDGFPNKSFLFNFFELCKASFA